MNRWGSSDGAGRGAAGAGAPTRTSTRGRAGGDPAHGAAGWRATMSSRLGPIDDATPIPNPARDLEAESRSDRAPRPTSWVRRGIWMLTLAFVLMALVGAGRLPMRTYLDNKAAIAETQQRLDGVRAGNQHMKDELALLDTDAELERVAREQYGYVKPGEEVYRVAQPPADAVAVPEVWPFTQLHDRLHAVDPTATTTPGVAGSTTTASVAPSTTTSARPTTTAPATTTTTTRPTTTVAPSTTTTTARPATTVGPAPSTTRSSTRP